MTRREVTELLQRDPEQEEQAGVRLAGLMAMLDESGYVGEPRLDVLGEILTSQGERFASDARVQIVASNERDQVIGVIEFSVSQGEPGYEAFGHGTRLVGTPTRIKVVVAAR